VLRERRELLVANQRLRIELEAATAEDASNPRVRALEVEVRRLEHALSVAMGEREALREGMVEALSRLQNYSGERRRGK
jgi:hypothetical protein